MTDQYVNNVFRRLNEKDQGHQGPWDQRTPRQPLQSSRYASLNLTELCAHPIQTLQLCIYLIKGNINSFEQNHLVVGISRPKNIQKTPTADENR